jgi:hypothetical protein
VPIAGTPVVVVSSSTLDTDSMREFIRDYASKNPLLADVEFSDTEINSAITDTIDHANHIARITTWTTGTFPSRYVLKLGAAGYLMTSESFRQVRNQASYQDGNIQPIGIDDKMAQYSQLAQSLKGEFVRLVTSLKVAENMAAADSLGSPVRQPWVY